MRRRPPEPGFKSEAQREAFLETNRLYRRGGPLAVTCGARLPGDRHCPQPPLAGEVRCLRRGGPDAARRFRARQLEGLTTGRVSPAEFARAEARRARNAQEVAWRKDPRLPGRTIDLGPHEWAFRDALRRRDVDVDVIYPAVADWLRWRWQRTQRDRNDEQAWLRACRDILPAKLADAEQAAFWAALGGFDKRTRQGKALLEVLRIRGREAAEALRGAWPPDGAETPRRAASPPYVRPWQEPASGTGYKRSLADPKRREVVRPLAPLPGINTEPDPVRDAELLYQSGPEVRAMFAAIQNPQDQRAFFAALRAIRETPDAPGAWKAWVAVVRRYRRT